MSSLYSWKEPCRFYLKGKGYQNTISFLAFYCLPLDNHLEKLREEKQDKGIAKALAGTHTKLNPACTDTLKTLFLWFLSKCSSHTAGNIFKNKTQTINPQ